MCDILKGSIYFKGNEQFTIKGLHGVLAFLYNLYLGVFWIMDHYTVLHFGSSDGAPACRRGSRQAHTATCCGWSSARTVGVMA
jgi:hypothetical protein